MALESRNPIFGREKEFQRGGYATFDQQTPSASELHDMYSSPSATSVDTGRMTIDDVVMRTATLFGLLLVAAAAVFIPISSGLDRDLDGNVVGTIPPLAMGLTILGAIVGFVLSLVISFSKKIRVPLILTYAVAEGLFVGGISAIFEAAYSGIVIQAVL